MTTEPRSNTRSNFACDCFFLQSAPWASDWDYVQLKYSYRNKSFKRSNCCCALYCRVLLLLLPAQITFSDDSSWSIACESCHACQVNFPLINPVRTRFSLMNYLKLFIGHLLHHCRTITEGAAGKLPMIHLEFPWITPFCFCVCFVMPVLKTWQAFSLTAMDLNSMSCNLHHQALISGITSRSTQTN